MQLLKYFHTAPTISFSRPLVLKIGQFVYISKNLKKKTYNIWRFLIKSIPLGYLKTLTCTDRCESDNMSRILKIEFLYGEVALEHWHFFHLFFAFGIFNYLYLPPTIMAYLRRTIVFSFFFLNNARYQFISVKNFRLWYYTQ